MDKEHFVECWKKSLVTPRKEKPEVIEGWLKKLYNYARSCVGSKDACVAYLKIQTKKLANEYCYDLFTLLRIISGYLYKNSKVGRRFIRVNMKWVRYYYTLVPEYTDEQISEIIGGMLYNLYGWLVDCYPAYMLLKGHEEELKRLVEDTCNLVASIAKRICKKMKYWGCEEKWVRQTSTKVYNNEGCMVYVGLSGVIEEISQGVLAEYKSVGPKVYKSQYIKNAGKIVRIKVSPKDAYIIAWFMIAHEFAHCITNICYGTQYLPAGRRASHGEAFVKAYRQILRGMAKYNPLIRKYVKL